MLYVKIGITQHSHCKPVLRPDLQPLDLECEHLELACFCVQSRAHRSKFGCRSCRSWKPRNASCKGRGLFGFCSLFPQYPETSEHTWQQSSSSEQTMLNIPMLNLALDTELLRVQWKVLVPYSCRKKPQSELSELKRGNTSQEIGKEKEDHLSLFPPPLTKPARRII